MLIRTKLCRYVGHIGRSKPFVELTPQRLFHTVSITETPFLRISEC